MDVLETMPNDGHHSFILDSDRIVERLVGVEIFCRWGSREEVWGRNFFPHGVEKEVGGGQILSSIIEERGKLSNT